MGALKQNRLTYMRDYGKKYRAAKVAAKKAKAELEPATLQNEGARRGRSCRECGNPVIVTSYWYCGEHNRLAGVEDINEYNQTEPESCYYSE